MAPAGRRAGKPKGSKNVPAYDGPQEDPRGSASASGSRGRAMSNAPSAGRDSSVSRGIRSPVRGPNPNSREASRTRLVQTQQAQGPVVLSRNVDFGGNAYNLYSDMPSHMMERGKFGKAGKAVSININSHIVEKAPTKDVYQYDILIGSGAEKRGLIRKISESRTFKNQVGNHFIFDGNKIGWSLANLSRPLAFEVDLDAEDGRTSSDSRKRNVHRVKIQKASNDKVRLYGIDSWLKGQSEFSTTVLESINFLDHLLRETPSHRHINLRRSYFNRTPSPQEVSPVSRGVDAIKGVYQSLRAVEGSKLVVNVDVSNSCFWQQSTLVQLAYQMSGERDWQRFQQTMLTPTQSGRECPMYVWLKRLHKNKFTVNYGQQANGARKEHTIKQISKVHNSKTHKFDVKIRETGEVKSTTLYDYFLNKYQIRLENPLFPIVETMKPGCVFPMEVCMMSAGQRYPYKLNEDQTTKMIKFAATRPDVRKGAIDSGLRMLNWSSDPVLAHYGLKINNQMLQTKARLLDPPEVLYANGTAAPGYSGRWDLRGKRFLKNNPAPLQSWGVLIMTQGQDRRAPITEPQVKDFIKNFISMYEGHGGRVTNRTPVIKGGIPSLPDAIYQTYQAAGNQAKAEPQILVVILPNKNAETYHRVKKNCEIRLGMVSQCMQASNVAKNQAQYISNVLMKLNCKLGGTTCSIKEKRPVFNMPTMIIGADVSHPAPGGGVGASIAALSVSMDRLGARYLAGVETNGFRVEMITPTNLDILLQPLVQHWMTNVGGGRLPQHVYYFRDGVSEGQYGALLNQELADIKRVFEQVGKGVGMPKFTVVVAEKRHHIRFFPPRGPAADRNMNPVPGVLVDKDVTHPFENDIYLCSHAAIQGTARPTHYQVLMDEAHVDVDQFQTLLYTHCYQFQRATTPVSLFPAVYYAHIAASRGVGRIDEGATQDWLARRDQAAGSQSQSSDRSLTEAPRLVQCVSRSKPAGTQFDMWYI